MNVEEEDFENIVVTYFRVLSQHSPGRTVEYEEQ
jgi:hypothetical protein